MGSDLAKQFILLRDKPVIWYSLKAIEDSDIIDDCILVVAQELMSYMREEILNRYGFTKVLAMVPGGSERFESVLNGIKGLQELKSGCDMGSGNAEVLYIHDGARPFLTEKIIKNCYVNVLEHKACVAGMPVKDTIKLADEEGFAKVTPPRKLVWQIQTPQVFDAGLVTECYLKLEEALAAGESLFVTDDASVVELFSNQRVKLVEASYENMKLTTPEDLAVAEAILNRR